MTCALIVGESAYRIHVHFKGFASYETAYLGDNLDPYIETLRQEGVDLTFMRNHEVSVHFPTTLEGLDQYDVVIISDAPQTHFSCILRRSPANASRIALN